MPRHRTGTLLRLSGTFGASGGLASVDISRVACVGPSPAATNGVTGSGCGTWPGRPTDGAASIEDGTETTLELQRLIADCVAADCNDAHEIWTSMKQVLFKRFSRALEELPDEKRLAIEPALSKAAASLSDYILGDVIMRNASWIDPIARDLMA